MSDTTWTIGELAEHAARALRAGAPSPPNGRVRDVPGERLIRWYTTIGLVDPPLTRRGRVARYGRRHLLQLVAVKRLQAAGRSIAEIQAALTGATDRMLEAAAHLESPPPAHHPDATGHVPAAADGARAAGAHAGAAGGGEPVRDRFWAERPGSRAAHAREAAPGAQTPVPGTSPSAHPPQEAHAPRREHPRTGLARCLPATRRRGAALSKDVSGPPRHAGPVRDVSERPRKAWPATVRGVSGPPRKAGRAGPVVGW
ncbi:MerR family transcriptional regulator [Nonomuraea rubra]|uniref:helix-turn-helix domain-containing protein n=1 Tax=Nonomuraea rubra TaxID=46180 RepID=UPI0036138C86